MSEVRPDTRVKPRWCYRTGDGLWHRCYRDRYSGYYYLRCNGTTVVLPEESAVVITCLPCTTRNK